MNKTLTFFGVIIVQLCSSLVFAGGPLIIEGLDGNTPVTYVNPNITLHVESGDLGEFTNDEADILLQQAFDLWNTVNTSTVTLIFDDTQIAVDINIDNFADFIPKFSGDTSNSDDGLNPVVYDSDGKIIEEFFYDGASNDIIGFAASFYYPNDATFSEGFAVISGKDPGRFGLTDTQFKLLIAHEIGHLFGLDHSQTNINDKEDICKTETQDKYPMMYPFVCRNEETLHTDEVSAISALYPAANINDNFGILQGNFVDESGTAILGANIWAENTATGEAISIVSDYLKQYNGFYKLVLPPGNYTLHANSINTLFNGGSSVGPYACDLSDKSFVSPHPIPEVTYQGATENSDEIITVSTGQTLNINFSITVSDTTIINDSSDSCSAIVISDDSSGSSGTSYITLLLLLSLLLLARYTNILNRRKLKTSFIIS